MSYLQVWNEIAVPEELDEMVINTVKRGYAGIAKERKSRRRWNLVVTAGGMAAAVAVFVTVGFLNPVVAQAYSQIPVLGNIFSYIYQLEDADIPFSQIAEEAEPVQTVREESSAVSPGDMVENNCGIEMKIRDSFCDGYSLYLSMEITSEEPFFEGAFTGENEKGVVQIFSSETVERSDDQSISIGNGVLNLRGVFSDPYTFRGIGRCGGNLEEFAITSGFNYQFSAGHIKVYAGEQMTDFRGDWGETVAMECTPTPLETVTVHQKINSRITFREIRMQPYEIQVVVAEEGNANLATECLCIEAFDNLGNRLAPASEQVSRFVTDRNEEIWMLEKPVDAESVTVYILDDMKWLDEWKGFLYTDNPWTGLEMMEFLDKNCFAKKVVEIK